MKSISRLNLIGHRIFVLLLASIFWSPVISNAGELDRSLESSLKTLPKFAGEHSVCYYAPFIKDAELDGINEKRRVRLASVTKLLTSYWVLSNLGPHFRFKTKFSWDSTTGELFIQGSRDPFFGRRRMLLLMSELNQLGITQINKVYFNDDFRYFQRVENPATYHSEISQRGGVSERSIVQQISKLMNTRQWDSRDLAQYKSFAAEAAKVRVKVLSADDLNLKVLSVENVVDHPFQGRVGLTEFVSESPDVKDYLKVINMYSINYPADELFSFFGGRDSFRKFLVGRLQVDDAEARVFTGSGLPTTVEGKRADTSVSCRTIVRIMMDMAKILSKHKMDLPDVMMVGGVDDGTLMGVYEQAPLRGSVVAKTGTIAHAVALAGFINTAQGRVYFGMFLQTRKILRARQVRNQMVAKIANHFGGSRPIDYDHGYRFVSFGQQSGLKKVESGLIAMP